MSWKCNHCGEEIRTHSIGHAECPKELTTLRERVRELEKIDRNWNAVNSMNVDIHEKLEARIKELEEAMPNPQKMRTTIHACFHGHTDAWDKLDEIADRIEKVMKR